MGSTNTSTSNIYIQVIEDVINKVQEEFVNDGGPGEGVLAELQGLWELKMMQAGAILGPIDRSAKQKAAGGPVTPNPVHDLNVPYEGTEEYETPTADILFPPTPLQTPMQTPLPGMAQTPLPGTAPTPLPGNESSSFYNIPTGGTPITPNEYSSNNDNGGEVQISAGAGRPNPYMQPPSSWMNQRPPLDVNVAYVEGREEGDKGAPNHSSTQEFFLMPSGKRKREDIPPPQYRPSGYIPQQDGAGDPLSEVDLGSMLVQERSSSCRIPQLDGPMPDPYDDALSTPNIYNYQGGDDYNIANTPMPNEMQAATPAPIPTEPAEDDDDDEPLNEDDDDDELDDLDQGEDLNTTHLVLAQFDKVQAEQENRLRKYIAFLFTKGISCDIQVTRTKSRWKCTLKDGIMHVNNKDILFNKATGEFDF